MRTPSLNFKLTSFSVICIFLFISTSVIFSQEPKMDTNVPIGWCVVPTSVGQPPQDGQHLVTVTGGNDGRVVRASSRSDFGYLCASSEALVIMAEGSFGTTSVGSNKTIVGKTHLGSGEGSSGRFRIGKSSNIIIRNFKVSGGADGIEIARGHHVWVDHCDFNTSSDGQIDMTYGADKITVTWCKFSNHNKVMLIQNGKPNLSEDKGRFSVTLSHLFFNGTAQRHPRFGYGKLHVLNSYYKNLTRYGIHIFWGAQATIEGSNFENTRDAVSHHIKAGDGHLFYIKNKFDAVSKYSPAETNKDKIFNVDEYYMYDWMVIDAEKVPEIVGNGVGTGSEWSKLGPIPIPGQGAVNVSKNPTLKWTKVGSQAANTVYFGKTFPPPKVETVNGNSFQPGNLDGGTVYYWKINDNDVWKFRTEGEAPTNVTQSFSINSNPVALTLYLNPARSELKLKLARNHSIMGVRDIILYDCLGKVIRKETILGMQHTMNVKTLPRGIYYISLTGKEGNIYRKFIRN